MAEPTRISFITNAEKRKSLDKIAEAYGKNLSTVINEAIDRYIDLHEPQVSNNTAAKHGDFATD